MHQVDIFKAEGFYNRLPVLSQRFTKFPGLFAMKLQPVESINQSRRFIQSSIDDDGNSRDLGGKLPDPGHLFLPLNEPPRSWVQIEPQCVCSRFNRSLCIGLVSDPANLDVHAICVLAKEALRIERVSRHGSIICCG